MFWGITKHFLFESYKKDSIEHAKCEIEEKEKVTPVCLPMKNLICQPPFPRIPSLCQHL
jgi:hypothetical protein